ncbi:MAG: hypothetical protein ACOYXC_00975 [Candidatus Rifleibacteriota bacterium]
MIRKIMLALIVFSAGFSFSGAEACSEYVHLWRPIKEEKSVGLSPEGIAIFLRRLEKLLPPHEKNWFICLNPASERLNELSSPLASAVALLENEKLVWHHELSPFSGEAEKIAAVWLDFVEPIQQKYWWYDDNKPPLPMFRNGEMESSVVRVMVRDSTGKIVLIEEFKHLFLLESDFMLPAWIGNGGAWLRRLSYQVDPREKRVEYTFSIPPDQETINATPPDIERFYFGEALPKSF